MAQALTRVRYAGLDFDTNEDEILARLQVRLASTYNDFAVSSLGIMLVDIFSFGLDTLSFYLDRRATDNFLSTARTSSSASRAARQLGYKVGAATAGSVDITVSLPFAQSFPITIPSGFRFSGPNGLVFEAQESATISAGLTGPVIVTASEGETITTTFASDGTPNQVFDIANVPNGKFVLGPGTENVSQVVVEIEGDVWEEQELLLFGQTNQFEIAYNDNPPTIRFGDSIAGNIPESGAEVRLTYFATTGVNGQATAETIQTSVSPLVVAFETIPLTINNEEGTSGGSDPESISSVKANAPNVFRSRGVNVTTPDYEARSVSFVDPVFGAVSAARAITVRGSSEDAFLASQLAAINAAAEDIKPLVDSAVSDITDSTSSISTEVASAQVSDDTLASSLSGTESSRVDASSANDGARVATGIIQSSSSGLSVDVSELETIVDGIPVGVSDEITTATKVEIENTIAAILGRNSEINTQASTVLSEVSQIESSLTSVESSTETSEELRSSIRADVDQIEIDNDSITATATQLSVDVDDISAEVLILTGNIDEHVDSFLSNECKSNLIEVPILTLDSEGFYVVPTLGLQKSLQRYLEAKKETTQVVKVTGASNQLLLADVDIFVGILNGFNEAQVRSQVEAEILNVLRGRKFGVPLRVSELYAPIAPSDDCIQIDGVDFVNIKITGPSDRVDPDGNLPTQEFEVVTRGVITIDSEIIDEASAVTV